MSPQLLFVDDDPTLRRVLSREIEDLGFEVQACDSAEKALEQLDSWQIDLALLDLSLPGMDGLALMCKLKERLPHVPAIMLTQSQLERNPPMQGIQRMRPLRHRAASHACEGARVGPATASRSNSCVGI